MHIRFALRGPNSFGDFFSDNKDGFRNFLLAADITRSLDFLLCCVRNFFGGFTAQITSAFTAIQYYLQFEKVVCAAFQLL